MNRRQFTVSSIAAAAGASTAGLAQTSDNREFYEMRSYELRYDMETAALNRFVEECLMPLLKQRTASPIGCFNVVSGNLSPSLKVLIPYDSAAKVPANTDLATMTDELSEKWKAFEAKPLPYVRYHSVLLKAFAGHPKIEVPGNPGESGHLFEVRTYESKNAVKSAAKIDMFNQEEIQIFRDCGMNPVFFGEGLVASRLPHLTYMMAYHDMAERQKVWGVFGKNKDWNRIKNDARWVDTVSNIHASFWSPTSYSEVR